LEDLHGASETKKISSLTLTLGVNVSNILLLTQWKNNLEFFALATILKVV
jgi:hypothetical protein